MTISERIGTARRERRVLARVSRAGWRLEQAERERTWALVSARAEGISIRTLATAIGPSPSRVHQLVADAGLDALDAALGELRAAGWPAPEGLIPGTAGVCSALVPRRWSSFGFGATACNASAGQG